MAALLDLKESINKVLKSNFEGVKLYSSDVEEGFKRPAFFTKVIPLSTEYDTSNYTSHSQMVVINYFSEGETEEENNRMHDEIRKAFGMTLKVNQRSFLMQNISSKTVDTVLQFKFHLNYSTKIEKTDTHENMKNLDVKITKE